MVTVKGVGGWRQNTNVHSGQKVEPHETIPEINHLLQFSTSL